MKQDLIWGSTLKNMSTVEKTNKHILNDFVAVSFQFPLKTIPI